MKTKSRLTISEEERHERIARKAYELYAQRGEEPGHALEDWFTAERLVQEELLHGPLSEEPALEEDEETPDYREADSSWGAH